MIFSPSFFCSSPIPLFFSRAARASRAESLKSLLLLDSSRPTFPKPSTKAVGRALLIGVIPGVFVSLFALLFAVSVSIQSENAARNFPVAALTATEFVQVILTTSDQLLKGKIAMRKIILIVSLVISTGDGTVLAFVLLRLPVSFTYAMMRLSKK